MESLFREVGIDRGRAACYRKYLLCKNREFLCKHNTLRGSHGTRKTQPSDLFDIKRVVNRLMVRRDCWPAMRMVAAQMQCAFEAAAREGGA
jgi:hypothetical protein